MGKQLNFRNSLDLWMIAIWRLRGRKRNKHRRSITIIIRLIVIMLLVTIFWYWLEIRLVVVVDSFKIEVTLSAERNITAILIIEVSRFRIISQDIIDYFLVLFLPSRAVFLKLNNVVMFPIPFIQVIHFFDETLFVPSRENRCQQLDFHRAITNLFFELMS